VLVTGRNEQRAASVVAEINRGGGTAAYHLTALDGAAARDLAAWAAEAGDGHVDILIDNAGVAPAGPTESATEAEFDQAFTTNVKARSSSLRPRHPPWPHAVRVPSPAPWSPASASQVWPSTGQAAPPSNC